MKLEDDDMLHIPVYCSDTTDTTLPVMSYLEIRRQEL